MHKHGIAILQNKLQNLTIEMNFAYIQIKIAQTGRNLLTSVNNIP